DFVGTTRNNNITVTVSVRGRASDPDVTFSSAPDLPQDEILARLLFGRSVTDLSPLQIARLAAAAAELAGGGGNSPILDRIRATTGLDNLDIVTQQGGGIGVEAGTYINENVYLGVQAGEESADATINLDVTPELKLRGTAGTRDTSLGIFYEQEY
ncbi:MAG: translocation/assembly module TamB domain-containing protein, partial [Hyphomicrobiales bacterium]|nr:translocation/assembly module TamB domain-containing protein [Hyphomicrobiales bacterium]